MKQDKLHILVSQPRPTSIHNPYKEMEDIFNVSFDFKQLIEIIGIDVNEFRRFRISLNEYPSVIFKSRHGIDHYFRLCGELKIKIPNSLRYYCISESIANYLQKYTLYRKRNIFIAEQNKLETLIPFMQSHQDEKFLMVVSDVNMGKEKKVFEEAGFHISQVPMYRTVPIEWDKSIPFNYYMLVLFTPSGVLSLKKNFPDWKQEATLIACSGPNTALQLKKLGFRIDIRTSIPECPSITQAIRQYLEENVPKKKTAL